MVNSSLVSFFSPPAFKSLTLSPLFSPSPLVFFPFLFFFYLGGAGVKGRSRGKTFDSTNLSWRNPFTDLCILAHKDKWVHNFPPDWGATKHISTFTGSQGAKVQSPCRTLLNRDSEPFGFGYLMVKIDYYTWSEASRQTKVWLHRVSSSADELFFFTFKAGFCAVH